MIVALTYTFHDDESQMLLVDTDKLNVSNKFEKDLKKVLEGKKNYVQLMGEKYEDNFGDWENKCLVNENEQKIDQARIVHVFFDC